MKTLCCRIAVVTMSACAIPAFADDTAAINGNWTISFQTTGGNELSGTLVITGDGGKWRLTSKTAGQGKNPCFKRDFPVVVTGNPDVGYTLDVKASATLQGCTDATVNAKIVDGKQVMAQFADGRPIAIVRQ